MILNSCQLQFFIWQRIKCHGSSSRLVMFVLQKWINIHLCSFKLFQGVISVRAFYLTTVISALSNEVIWNSFRCPSKLSQTRMDFLVQWSDSLPEQSTFFRWQNSNDSVEQVKTKYVSTFLLAFSLSDDL